MSATDGIEAVALPRGVVVRVARDPVPPEAPPDSAIAREWDRQRAATPRLFNGAILSTLSIDAEAGEVLARRETYQRLVVQPRVMTGVRLLSVTGILVARDERGREHVLLGRRAAGVRLYGGMWEIGPSGGLPAPPAAVETLEADALAAHLADETHEEIGLDAGFGSARVVAVVRDHFARSDDVCLRVDAGALDPLRFLTPANWEYEEVKWVAADEFRTFAAENEMIAASRALAGVMGW